jgi:predicted nucleic acid-binding protein
MILCDTNILIELYKNNAAIVTAVEAINQDNVAISDVTRAELFVGARNKCELQILRKEVSQLTILPIQQEIYHNIDLLTLNIKDFIYISGINLYQL